MRGKPGIGVIAFVCAVPTILMAAPAQAAGPFATASTLPYQAPRFDITADRGKLENSLVMLISRASATASTPRAMVTATAM